MKVWLLRTLYFGIPAVVLLVSIVAMNAGPILKRPVGGERSVPAHMARISELALTDRWAEAGEAGRELERTWEDVKGRVRFTSTIDDMEIFDLELAALIGAIEARDQSQLRIAHRRLQALWNDLGS